MAGGQELLAKLEVVEDLSVLDDPDRRVLVVHRLVAALQVDDREPAHAKRHAVELDRSVVVGSAVDHRRAHPLHELAALCRVTARHAADAAHLSASHLARTAGLPFVTAERCGAFSMISRTT